MSEEGLNRIIDEINKKKEQRWNPDLKGKQHVIVLDIWKNLLKEYFQEKTPKEIAADEKYKYALSIKKLMYKALEQRCKKAGHNVAAPTLRRIINTHTDAKDFFKKIDDSREL